MRDDVDARFCVGVGRGRGVGDGGLRGSGGGGGWQDESERVGKGSCDQEGGVCGVGFEGLFFSRLVGESVLVWVVWEERRFRGRLGREEGVGGREGGRNIRRNQ